MLRLLFAILLIVPFHAVSDVTGVGDTAIIAKLTSMLETANQQLKAAKEYVDLQKHMTDLQENNFIKTLSDTGKSVIDLYAEIDQSKNLVERWKYDPLGTKLIESDIQTIESRLQEAEKLDDVERVAAYGRILHDLRTIKWMAGTSNDAIKREAGGISADDAAKQAASEMAKLAKMMADASRMILDNKAEQVRLEASREKLAEQGRAHMRSTSSVYSHLK